MMNMFLATALLAGTFALPARSQDASSISQAEAENSAKSVATFCKAVTGRMEGSIHTQGATQDLQDLATSQGNMQCHQIFSVDERVRWLLR